MATLNLLTYGSLKTEKGEKYGYLTGIMYLAPFRLSGHNVCPMASKGCAAACLNTAGRGVYQRTQDSRLRKTLLFFNDRNEFMRLLVWDIRAVIRRAEREKMIPTIRLNGTSDIRWENEVVTIDGTEYRNVMEAFPNLQFYDYTKIPNRRNLPSNYHLTFSVNESNHLAAKAMLTAGMNVAVVFRKKLPETFWDRPVVSGDDSDLRFLDRANSVVGLTAKGRARKDTSGFVFDA